jgi:hypothetical protein
MAPPPGEGREFGSSVRGGVHAAVIGEPGDIGDNRRTRNVPPSLPPATDATSRA